MCCTCLKMQRVMLNLRVYSSFFHWSFFIYRKTSICCPTYLCIHWLLLVCALTRDQTHNLGVLGQCSNQLSCLTRAKLEGLDVDSLVIEHIQVNKAPKLPHRIYRAHEQINPYVTSPCHTEMIRSEKEQIVPKQEKEVAQKKKMSQEKLKKQTLAQE